METAFPTVLIVVVAVAAVVAFITFLGAGKAYDGIGRGAFSLDEAETMPGPAPGTGAARAEADAEIRQMLEARNARRIARGEEPLDVEGEVDRQLRDLGA